MSVSPRISLDRLAKIADSLPGAPKVLQQLQDLLRDPNSDLDMVAQLLRRDGVLTARIIRIANGVLYSRGDPVASLDEALARVGFSEVFRLISVASMLQMAEVTLRYYPHSARQLRENALFCALLMEALAPEVGLEPRPAYTAGLLRLVGRIVLDVAAQRELRIYQVPTLPEHEGLVEWELELFGVTNYEVGSHVLKSWRLPAEVFVAVRDQHLHNLKVDALPNAKLLHVVVTASYGAGYGLRGGRRYSELYAQEAREALNLSNERVASAVQRVQARFEQIKAMMA